MEIAPNEPSFMVPMLRQQLYKVFHEPDPSEPFTLIDNYLVPILIAIDVAALILESLEPFAQEYAALFRLIERFIIAIFTLEYLLRLWSCVENPAFAEPVRGRLRYIRTAFALVDLAAFLPFYTLNLMPTSWAVIAGPFFRLLRLLKLTRYSESTQIFFRVLRDKRDELLTTLFVVLTLLVVASSLMYFIEREAQPLEFSSIPAAMWWGVITLTTVGYGDVHPITPLGKFLSAILAFLGIGVFALPARDIAAAFSEEMQKRRAIANRKTLTKVQPAPSASDFSNLELLNFISSVPEFSDLEQTVEFAADLMRLCVQAAQQKLGDQFENEEMVRDLAIVLFQETSSRLKSQTCHHSSLSSEPKSP